VTRKRRTFYLEPFGFHAFKIEYSSFLVICSYVCNKTDTSKNGKERRDGMAKFKINVLFVISLESLNRVLLHEDRKARTD
jgi:hypothetical protein